MKGVAGLVESIITAGATASPFTVAVITGLSPLTAMWNDTEVELTNSLRDYSPFVNDVVLLARVGPQLIALGALD